MYVGATETGTGTDGFRQSLGGQLLPARAFAKHVAEIVILSMEGKPTLNLSVSYFSIRLRLNMGL